MTGTNLRPLRIKKPKPMTKAQAWAEAHARWRGPDRTVKVVLLTKLSELRCVVGYESAQKKFTIKGRGRTWEEAFLNS